MVSAEDLRAGMRRLASGVSIISTQVEAGRFAMTASSVTSLSDDPASLLVCINLDAAIEPHIKQGVFFAVSILSAEQQAISNLCAQKDTGEERFAVDGWANYDNDDLALPYVADAQAIFICEVDSDNIVYGTHQIVIGKLRDVIVPSTDVDPLVYADGAYQRITPVG